jgi:hypothetical protein
MTNLLQMRSNWTDASEPDIPGKRVLQLLGLPIRLLAKKTSILVASLDQE